MLNAKVDEVLFHEDGKAKGVRVGEDSAYAPIVICDPSYTTEDRLLPKGRVIRAVCLLDHPIPDTNNSASTQIIIPAKQLKRNTGK